ncbi:hypothetical protein RNN91_04520 [Mycoplasmopsis felis]|nr:hypothetical protein [Mycoplasmopsis felis]WQQ01571.1 hypothetical protein RRG54_03205 [Mycoplasmopsis felis]
MLDKYSLGFSEYNIILATREGNKFVSDSFSSFCVKKLFLWFTLVSLYLAKPFNENTLITLWLSLVNLILILFITPSTLLVETSLISTNSRLNSFFISCEILSSLII